MTTNQTIDGVSRELLEQALLDARRVRFETSKQVIGLRTLLDIPRCPKCEGLGYLVIAGFHRTCCACNQTAHPGIEKLSYWNKSCAAGGIQTCGINPTFHPFAHRIDDGLMANGQPYIPPRNMHSEQPTLVAASSHCKSCQGRGSLKDADGIDKGYCAPCDGSGKAPSLSADELRFLEAIALNPGCKLNGGIAWDDEGNSLWGRLEVLGLIECVGGYKWKLAFSAVELGVKAYLCRTRPAHANPPLGTEPSGTHHDNDGLDEMRKP